MIIPPITLFAIFFALTLWRLTQMREKSGIDFVKIRALQIQTIQTNSKLTNLVDLVDHLRKNHPYLLSSIEPKPKTPLRHVHTVLGAVTGMFQLLYIPMVVANIPYWLQMVLLALFTMAFSLESWLQYCEHKFICTYKEYNK